ALHALYVPVALLHNAVDRCIDAWQTALSDQQLDLRHRLAVGKHQRCQPDAERQQLERAMPSPPPGHAVNPNR
ncbi:hypothetical protein ACW3SN_21075, partial [Xanthomonas campestris]